MYRGFNISLEYENKHHHSIGLSLNNERKKNVRQEISSFLSIDGEIDGDELESAWFPKIEADIFISHSHLDERLAITLAGWLHEKFGLRSFIDSTVWGYSDSLLHEIDKEYCYNDEQKIYSYQKRNLSTSHIHMMLGTALAKIMDTCECLFFLNTPNSMKASEAIEENQTNSPWLYYEIGISNLIQKPIYEHTNRGKIIKGTKIFSQLNEDEKQLFLKYKLDMKHLVKINNRNLAKWANDYENELPKPEYPLDLLYELF